MEIVIADTPDAVAGIAADILAGYARKGATLGLATGSTPLKTYQELIRRHQAGELSFAHCHAYLLDEYVGLSREHEQSYYRTIRTELTDHIDIADENVHSPDGTTGNPMQAARDYDALIAASGGVDVQVLGIGTDGHIGFNEPGSSLSSRTRLKTLHPQTVTDNARFFGGDEDAVPFHVITQGLGTIMEAGHLLMIVTGAAKAEAVAAFVEGPVAAICPASILQFHQRATVIVDQDAAAQLQHSEYYRYALDHKPEGQDF